MSITITNLRKYYGKSAAVDDFTLEIPSATVFGLLGPNGAGKSTTFKCLLGLARPTSGTISLEGGPLVPATFETLGYVPEKSALYEWLTVGEHLEFNRRYFKSYDPKRAADLIDMFKLDRRKRVKK